MFVYLVSLPQDGQANFTKKIAIHDKSEEAVLSEIKAKFSTLLPAAFRLKVLDPDFNSYVDVDDFEELPERGELQIVIEKPPAAVNVNDQEAESDELEEAIGENDGNGNRNNAGNANTDGRGVVTFPLVYRLPVFPRVVKEILATDPIAIIKQSSGTWRHDIIRALYDQCSQYEGGYVEKYYDTICRTLVATYPALRDATTSCTNKNPYGINSWKKQLSTKFKGERAKLDENDTRRMMRQKHGHMKNKRRSAPVPLEGRAKRRKSRTELQLSGSAESSETEQRHIEVIQREWAKEDPDLDLVKDRMDRTTHHRATLYADPNVAVVEILSFYPCLRDSSQVIADGQRLLNQSANVKRESWFTDDKLAVLTRELRRKKNID